MTLLEVAMAKKHSRLEIRPWFAIVGLLLPLLVAACSDAGTASDNGKRPVFYGGVSGGGVTTP
jgi:hypothetical protein